MPSSVMTRLARWGAVAVALAVVVFGLARGTWAAGGSDSSCYALMADAFARGEAQPVSPLAQQAPWPAAQQTFAPAGFIPSPVRPAAASPICAPGFALLLAPFRVIGGRDGIFVATPIFGALAVWLAWRFTSRIAGPLAGLAAALVVASTPVFLFQVTQPMNDVASAALWMAVLTASLASDPARPWLLGVLTGVAVLVRPNLAPAAAIIAVWLTVVSARSRGATPGLIRRNLTAFVLAGLPSAVVLAALNTILYGGPLESGYGRARELFSLANVTPNARHYADALLQTQLGLPFLGVAAPFVLPRPFRHAASLIVAVSGAIAAVYLAYRPYDEWWYLRFLLPAIVPMTALSIAVLSTALGASGVADRTSDAPRTADVRRTSDAHRTSHARRTSHVALRTAFIAIVVAVTFHGIRTARDRQAFDLHRLERRFWLTAEVARERLPANAVFLTIWESGSLLHHAERTPILWDSLDADALDPALAWLSARGLEPFIVVEQWEEPRFRERFEGRSPLGALDWPPRFEIDRQVRIFKPSDREAYLKGAFVATEQIIPR